MFDALRLSAEEQYLRFYRDDLTKPREIPQRCHGEDLIVIRFKIPIRVYRNPESMRDLVFIQPARESCLLHSTCRSWPLEALGVVRPRDRIERTFGTQSLCEFHLHPHTMSVRTASTTSSGSSNCTQCVLRAAMM